MASPSMAERLGQFWVFEELTDEELEQVAKLVKEKTFRSRDIVFRQGEQPDFFYLIERGAILETGEDPPGQVVLRRRAEKGDFVGRYSLLHNTVRRATAVATGDTAVLAINAADFKALLAAIPKLLDRLRRIQVVNRLLATPLFNMFTETQVFQVADLARIVEYPPGEVIYQQGEPSDAFYVIDTGQVKESVSGSRPSGQIWPKHLTAGHFFGRRDLLSGVPRRATAEAVSEVHLFRFNADAFHWLCKLQPAFAKALDRPDVLAYLRQIPLFSRLSADELKELAGYVGLAHLPAGEVLYRQGESDPTLYFLYEGEAVMRLRDEKGRDRPIGYLRPGDFIGEQALLLQDPRGVTVEPVIGSSLIYLTHWELEQFLERYPGVRGKFTPAAEVQERQQIKRFAWMDPDEVFVLRERRHWFFVVNRLILPAFFTVLALVLLVLDIPRELIILALIGTGLWMIWRTIDWANDYYILTTKRVAHREKVLGVRESRDETPLDKIQNMNIDQGFWGNLFGFGNLIIDTAAAVGVTRVTFDYLGEPEQVQSQIFEQVALHRAGERSETRQVIRDRLEKTIGTTIRPTVPRPAIPQPELVVPALTGTSTIQQVTDATFGRWFWIQKRDGDRVMWRKHWIRLAARIWMPALFLFFVVIALVLLIWTELPGGVTAITAVLLLPGLAWLWWNWENWGNDLYIVSNDRIIDIEALPLGFRTKATETTFDRIQNISYEIPNPVATLLNYGTVVIYTAGAVGQLDFQYVSNPKGVQAEIFRRVTAYQTNQQRQQRRQQWDELPQWFATYEEMKRS